MKNKKAISLLLTSALAVTALFGCSTKNDEKISVKVQYITGRMNMNLEQVLEDKFPDVDIVTDEVIGNFDYVISHDLQYGFESDVYLYEALPIMDDALIADKFYDLARESFTNNYYLSAISDCVNDDGGLYYLPGPVYVYGIIYDKTAFNDLGLSVPHSYSEFVQLLNDVRDRNLTGEEPDPTDPEKTVTVDIEPFVPTVKWPDMWKILFDSFAYEKAFRGAANTLWLSKYQKGEESMIGHMEGAAEKFLQLFEDGVLSTDFWDVKAPVRSNKLYRYHTSLMTVECQSGLGYNQRENAENPENLHELGMMPFYTSDEPGSDYLVAMPRCYFGMTKKAAKNNAKKEAILKIFEYLSTTEGQDLLIEGGGGEINLLKNNSLPDDPFYDEIRETIAEDRTVPRTYYAGKTSVVEQYMHSSTPALVNGEISVQEWLQGADAKRDETIHAEAVPVAYGTSPQTFSVEETSIIIGQAYIHATGAEIGIVPCTGGYGTKNKLYEGLITVNAIDTLATTRMPSGVPIDDIGFTKIVLVEITGEQLFDLLNTSYADVFVGTAGLEVEYAPNRKAGKRYVSIKYQGKEVKATDSFTAAIVRGAAKNLQPTKIFADLEFRNMFIDYLNSVNGTVPLVDTLKIVK